MNKHLNTYFYYQLSIFRGMIKLNYITAFIFEEGRLVIVIVDLSMSCLNYWSELYFRQFSTNYLLLVSLGFQKPPIPFCRSHISKLFIKVKSLVAYLSKVLCASRQPNNCSLPHGIGKKVPFTLTKSTTLFQELFSFSINIVIWDYLN